jgi:hypothetical protein
MDEKVIYQILKKENPSFSESRLRATAKQIVDNPEILESGMLGGLLTKAAATKIGKGLKAVGGLAGTLVARQPGGKVAKGKTALRVGGVGFAGLAAQQMAFGGGDSGAQQTPDLQGQSDSQLLFQLAKYQAEGGDPAAIVESSVGQQLFKGNPRFNIKAILNSGNVNLGDDTGVYTGKSVSSGGQYIGSQFVPNESKTSIPLKDWTNQFPIADPKALAAWKAKLVSAGVVSASAGLPELKKQWEAWGEYSQDMNKQGKKLTPDQLLDIQRGLWGGGDGRDYSTQYRVDMLKPENVKSLYKAARQQEAGAIVGDEAAGAFAERVAAQQIAKPTKTEYKKIKGKMTPVTTPGYGEAEAAAAAVALAKKDPLYAEFQTANVFGSALERALGVRP